MSFYYSQLAGSVFEATGAEKWALDREIDLQKGAARAGVPQTLWGPYATRAEAQAAQAAHPSVVDQARNAGPIAEARTAIGDALSTLVKLEIRVVEAAVGIVLLAVAANAILKQTTGADPLGASVRAGKRAGRAAVTAAAVA